MRKVIMNISSYRLFNAVCLYLMICIALFFIGIIIRIFLGLGVCLMEKIMEKSENKVLGKKHEKSLKYNYIKIWFIKVQADIEILLSWIKYDICKVKSSYEEKNEIKIKRVKIFTFESLSLLLRKCWNFFFSKSFLHILSAIYVADSFYGVEIKYLINKMYIMIINIKISNIHDYFEAFLVLFLAISFIFDKHHKVIGYREIRIERFKSLFQMEEKLLDIFIHIHYKLEKNIEILVNHKQAILQSGIQNLTGNECIVQSDGIKYINENLWQSFNLNDKFYHFINLEDMKEELNALADLDNAFMNSSLMYSNIFMVDQEALLTRFVHLYFPENLHIENKKIELLCKSSMQERFENNFIKPTISQNIKKYRSKEEGVYVALKESSALDYDLKRAFELEVYMKIMIRRMERRIKKIHKFTKYNPN